MRKMLCPQCKIAAMYVKNEAGDRRLVYVVEGERSYLKIRKSRSTDSM